MRLERILCISTCLLSGANRSAALLLSAAPHDFHRRANAIRRAQDYLPMSRRYLYFSSGRTQATLDSAGNAIDMPLPAHFTAASTVAWIQQVLASFEDAFGYELIDGLDRSTASPEETARVAARWQCGLVSHDFLRSVEDPIFIYGNEAALQTFGYTWKEFIALPSRKSCEEKSRGERQDLLDDVKKKGKGAAPGELPGVPQTVVRVTKGGQRIKISVLVWNVKDTQGRIVGQAARPMPCD